jgi:hypothetical protein
MAGRLATAILVLLVFTWPRPASPETVELIGGEWVEGALKEATPTGVVLEIGGQSVKFPADKVRAIYFGAPPQSPAPILPPASSPADESRTPSPAGDALQVVKSLRAAILGGMGLREYQARVAGVTTVVDRYLAALPDGPESDTIHDAARYYALAAAAWNNQGAVSRTVWLRKDEALARCPAYQDFVRAMRAKGESFYAERVTRYVVISDGVISVLWSCASEKIGEAEALLAKDKK